MAFETERKKYAREPFKYYEVEVGATTYKICENVGPIPAGLDAIPLVKSASKRPPRVSLEGGIGLRASISVGFNEGLDYRYFGTESAPVRFWINWRARNVGYQGGRISEFSGYIVNGAYDLANFERRDYIIESFSHNASGASITGKDTLKMISGDRAKAPRKSEGILSAALLVGGTTFDLTPAGIGNSSYPASGWIRLGDEVVSFTRSADTFTIVRAQYNTLAEEHGINDLAQLCLYYSDNISNILYNLYTVYAGVPTAQINKPQWDDEINLNLPGLYETLITEPVGVDALAKELCESAPHFQYYDERINSIVLTAIKAPPDILQCYTAEANILEASSNIKDEPEMRISTVIVRFGQRDPTKKLDDSSNYKQAQVRKTPLSIAKYGGVEKYSIINSRWISNGNRAAAIRLAARRGRRFEEMPRSIGYNLDSRDADVWTGQSMAINSDLTLRNSAPYDRFCMPVQVFSVGESKDYQYRALEHTYGAALPEDEDSDDPNYRPVYISGQTIRIEDGSGNPQTLREAYDAVWPDLLAAYNVVFIFDLSCVAGSDDITQYAVVTSSGNEFSVLTTPILLDVRGLIVGKGGFGANVNGTAGDGGPAISLDDNVRLSNTGIIGGGGGGGDWVADVDSRAPGGGGAGFENSDAGTGSQGTSSTIPAEDGSNALGGDGGISRGAGAEPSEAIGGDGGNLGENGQFGGGTAGAAINQNGYTITYINTGDIRGEITGAPFFATTLYTGNGTTQDVVSGLNLVDSGGLVWIKSRDSTTSHALFDTTRGATKSISSNAIGGETTVASSLTAFNSDGFTISNSSEVNLSANPYVSWQFIKKQGFFDKVTYVGDGVAGRTVAIDLEDGTAQFGMALVKLTSGSEGWFVQHRSLLGTQYLRLNTTAAVAASAGTWDNTSATTAALTVGTWTGINQSGNGIAAYLFAHNPTKGIFCGSYTGTGAAGNAVVTGFPVGWLMVKRTDASADWFIVDVVRSGGPTMSNYLLANTSVVEGTTTLFFANADGFTVNAVTSDLNASGGNYIFMAIADPALF